MYEIGVCKVLEVVFGESIKGSMKMAKNYDMENMLNGAFAFSGRKPSEAELRKMYEGKPIGGKSSEVVTLGHNLDIGSIKGDVDGRERQRACAEAFGHFEFTEADMEHFFNMQRSDFNQFMKAAEAGETIRIWKDSTPNAMCGFYYACYLTRELVCDIRVVELPRFEKREKDIIVEHANWGEVAPGQLYKFLSNESVVEPYEKMAMARRWMELMEEDAPLRALLSGCLVSVAEDFYDSIIIQNLPEKPIKMARFIGNLLGHYPIGIGDSWYARRIFKMIDDGRLKVVDWGEADHPYSLTFKRREG